MAGVTGIAGCYQSAQAIRSKTQASDSGRGSGLRQSGPSWGGGRQNALPSCLAASQPGDRAYMYLTFRIQNRLCEGS